MQKPNANDDKQSSAPEPAGRAAPAPKPCGAASLLGAWRYAVIQKVSGDRSASAKISNCFQS